jgi:ferredoxin
MAYVIAEPCVGVKDTAFVGACPVDRIHPKKHTAYKDGRPTFAEVDKLYIDPAECIDCGACVPVCPVAAIFSMEELPEEWRGMRRWMLATWWMVCFSLKGFRNTRKSINETALVAGIGGLRLRKMRKSRCLRS